TAEAGEVVGEVGQLGSAETAYRFCHGSLCADAGARLIVLERPQQISLALPREPRHLLAAGKVGIVAGTADAFARQLGPAAVAGLVDGVVCHRRSGSPAR